MRLMLIARVCDSHRTQGRLIFEKYEAEKLEFSPKAVPSGNRHRKQRDAKTVTVTRRR